MRILIVGAAGTFGRAIHQRLQERGHDIITVGRTTGDIRCDIADERQLAGLWEQAGQLDAVVSAAGEVKYAPLDQLSSSDFLESFTQKGLAQINLVRTGLDHIASRGSFTLTSGIPSRDPVISSAAAATVNGAVEAFARAAAIEIAPRRINVVSPSVATESLETFGDYFPGFASVDLADVARGFQKSVEGAATGQVIILP